MKIYVDSDTNQIITDAAFKAPVNGVSFKRGDASKVEVIFVTGNTAEDASEDRSITFGIKAAGKFDGDFLVSASDFTISETSYVLAPSFNTVELNDLLNSGDDDDTNDVASVAAMLEITWSDDEGDTWLSTNTITATIFNDVVKGVEGTPLESPTPLDWLETYRPQPIQLFSPPTNGGPGFSMQWSLGGTPVTVEATKDMSDVDGKPAYTVTTNNGFVRWSTSSSRWDYYDWINDQSMASDTDSTYPKGPWYSPGEDPSLSLAGPDWGGTSGQAGQFAFVNHTGVYVCTLDAPQKWVALN
jgi:hypothetical protein